MRYAIILLLLCGCTKIVYVPTPVPCPEPKAVVRPHWPIADLRGSETYGEIIRAYGASLQAERGYSTELEIILKGYRK
jgi:hypothetical protein